MAKFYTFRQLNSAVREYLNSAGDSKDDGVIFIYRYKKTGKKGYFPWSLMLASHRQEKDPCKGITCSNHGTYTSVAGKRAKTATCPIQQVSTAF
ncbi:MAG TPA: hypothetical protein ENK84_08235 [Desulfobulbus sp.]|nr:hypothetical protein [Desulfobulbus sp.]